MGKTIGRVIFGIGLLGFVVASPMYVLVYWANDPMDSAAWTLFISMALAVIGSALIEVNPSNRRTAG